MSDRNHNRRPRGGRGGGRGSGRGNGRGGSFQNGRGNENQFQNKRNIERKDEPKKELSFYYKECKEKKEFKVGLGGSDSEKVQIPSYGDSDQDETLLLLVKDFNLLIEDGDLFKEDSIGTEENDRPFTGAKNRTKLISIKEVYRKFRSCLKGEARDTWLKLVEDQPILATDNYAVDNTYGVKNFIENQKKLAKAMLDDEAIEDIKTYLQTQKKPRSMHIDNYIRRTKTLNNYIPLMDIGATELTEREMIRQVVLKGIPVTWNLDLKRANNHKCATLAELQKILKPIEEADEAERRFNDGKKKRGGGGDRHQHQHQRQHQHEKRNGGGGDQRSNAGDKPCRKQGHDHKWKNCPDNRYGNNFEDNESNATERTRRRDSTPEREVRFQDDDSCNMMELFENEDDTSVQI